MLALTAPIGVAVACVWMTFVKVSVRMPQATVIPTMFRPAIKTFIMSAFMVSIDTSMNSPVLRVITCVTIRVRVGIVGAGRCSNCGQHQCCGSH